MDKKYFVKQASEVMDLNGIETHVIDAAYNVYNEMPVKSASIVLGAYDTVEEPMAKLAFEVIGAYMVKESEVQKEAFAPIIAAAGSLIARGATLLRGAAGTIGTHLGLAGASAAMQNSGSKTSTLEQGTQAVSRGV